MPASDRKTKQQADDETAVLEKIAGWREPHRAIGERLHAAILESVPDLKPRLWYGMPGYAKSGPVLCFFRSDDPYMTFGLTEKANFGLEDDAPDKLMECSWFFEELDDATEARIVEIVRKGAN